MGVEPGRRDERQLTAGQQQSNVTNRECELVQSKARVRTLI